MKKIAKTILERTIWLGRGTATMMGVAVLLALTVGAASTALAGTGAGARFHLGKVNVVDGVTITLQGSLGSAAGLLEVTRGGGNGLPALRVENTSSSLPFSGIGVAVKVPST